VYFNINSGSKNDAYDDTFDLTAAVEGAGGRTTNIPTELLFLYCTVKHMALNKFIKFVMKSEFAGFVGQKRRKKDYAYVPSLCYTGKSLLSFLSNEPGTAAFVDRGFFLSSARGAIFVLIKIRLNM
jgi:hypothetical protein